MRKIMILFLCLFLLVGCTLSPAPFWKVIFPPSISGFDFGPKCPHGCWLGIIPGVTKIVEARAKLQAIPQIDNTSWHEEGNVITVDWNTRDFPCDVDIIQKQDTVKNISFGVGTPYDVNDFISLLGEPDEIGIMSNQIPDNPGIQISYLIYYASRQFAIEVIGGDLKGPNPDDNISMLILNVDNDNVIPVFLNAWQHRQPWLGYGHLNDYLPGGIQYSSTDIPLKP